ncbi:Uncharacterized membrane protein [Sedimentitalea nanhaiensis]|uniref:Uncharacterized membrane protein n=2 Tax=Sedimentitalea nanhaiensis TaxID=999627 RepID=A0A1I7EB72_9RHOB|nr:Uncharacterized membrane protein [Sedimentitalea nanhaiensis]
MSLMFGLIAALAWGIHDLLVRHVSQRSHLLTALLVVLASGALVVAPVAAAYGDWSAITPRSYGLSIATGACFGLASLGLYGAFAIGPVRLVAPIVGAFPVLSVGWASVNGIPVTVPEFVAVLAIVAGVALVAILSNDTRNRGERAHAITLALLAALGFATTFAFGQAASRLGADFPVILCTRAAAVAAMALLLLATRGGQRPAAALFPPLVLMGVLDTTALGLVTAAGSLDRSEYAAVAASLFGLITILLARVFLHEPMTRGKWGAAVMVFVGIGYLGF